MENKTQIDYDIHAKVNDLEGIFMVTWMLCVWFVLLFSLAG